MSYLEQTFTSPPEAQATARPPHLSGLKRPGNSKLLSLRKEQLLNLCRAWDLMADINPLSGKDEILDYLLLKERNGLFLTKPVHEYYLRQSKFDSDQTKDAKSSQNKGWCRDNTSRAWIPCEALQPWSGPSPDGEKPKPRKAMSEAETNFKELQQQAKTLGMNTMAKTREELQAFVDAATAATETTEGNI